MPFHPVENEYGSWGACDLGYVSDLATHLYHFLGPKTVLFTTDGDGDGFLKCGKIKEAYATVDFGPGDAAIFKSNFAAVQCNNQRNCLLLSQHLTPSYTITTRLWFKCVSTTKRL